MALMQADVGAIQILNKYFKDVTPVGGAGYTLKLFTNNVTPTDTDTSATFVEAVGGGYAAKALVSADFTVSTQAGIAQAAIAQQSFVFTGPLTTNTAIYGYYVVDADGVLIFADVATAPYTPTSAGDLFAVAVTYKLSHGTPA